MSRRARPPQSPYSARTTECTVDSALSHMTRFVTYGRVHRAQLSHADIVKAFRVMGGVDGLQFSELHHFVGRVANKNVRNELWARLKSMFAEVDYDKDGTVDVMGFADMISNSTLLETAVYEMLLSIEEDGQKDINKDVHSHVDLDLTGTIDVISMVVILINAVTLIVQIDTSWQWTGWQFFELGFLCLYSAEFAIRCQIRVCRQNANVSVPRTSNFYSFLLQPMIILDISLLIFGWLDFSMSLASIDMDLGSHVVRWARSFRLARGIRLLRCLHYLSSLRLFIASILSGMWGALWGFISIALLVSTWSIVIRTAVASQWTSDHASMSTVFPNMFECMLVVFRCLVFTSSGRVLTQDGSGQYGSVYNLLTDEFGSSFQCFWLASELFIFGGVLYSVAAMYVVRAFDAANEVQQKLNEARRFEDMSSLKQLDKLLRSLVHPCRDEANPKDRNAGRVAKMIRKSHPQVAAAIPNLEVGLVELARSIQDARKLHQSVADAYEYKEPEECKRLFAVPAAKTYLIAGSEKLCVCSCEDKENSLDLYLAPIGAPEISLDQEETDLHELLKDAIDVQRRVKSVIFPKSKWSGNEKADSSGDIWKSSKGLCDEALDPGVKSEGRTIQKVNLKYRGKFEQNRDYARLALIYNSVDHLVRALPRFLAFTLETDGLRVMTLENRFANPHPLGWRDLSMLLKVKVPSRPSQKFHIMEVQLRLQEFMNVHSKGHEYYEQIRACLPEDVFPKVVDNLVTHDILDLSISQNEWSQCVLNKEVQKILRDIGVPSHAQRSLFDLIDTDGSGTVNSSELLDILRIWKTPVQSPDLAACCKRLRGIQQDIHCKLGPEVNLVRFTLWQHMKNSQRQLENIQERPQQLFRSSGASRVCLGSVPRSSPMSTKDSTDSTSSSSPPLCFGPAHQDSQISDRRDESQDLHLMIEHKLPFKPHEFVPTRMDNKPTKQTTEGQQALF